MKNYSQYNQDVFISKIFNKKGIFLDIGANGGVIDSNTYYLEKHKSWTGICVEPIKEKFQILKTIRSAKCYNIGISDAKGFVDFYHVKGYAEMLSGIVSNFTEEHRDRLKREIQLYGGEVDIIKIEVKPINLILEEINLKKVDYCSIDVEGSEYEIIKNINFNDFEILCFSIENNYNDNRIYELLSKNNYKRIKRLGNDEIYIINKLYRRNTIQVKLLLMKIQDYTNIFLMPIKRVLISFYKKIIKKYLLLKYKNILLRDSTSDNEVFEYVFLEKYHRPNFSISKNPVILDLGANVGFAALDLKQKYPNSKIYCYELCSSNFQILVNNISKFKDIIPFNNAVWIRNELVNFDNTLASDALHIDNSISTGSKVLGITMDQIFAHNNLIFVDYVKMDIEGAEFEIFNSDLEWLKKIHSIKVEIHNKEHFDFIFSKLLSYNFNVWKDTKHWSTICAVR